MCKYGPNQLTQEQILVLTEDESRSRTGYYFAMLLEESILPLKVYSVYSRRSIFRNLSRGKKPRRGMRLRTPPRASVGQGPSLKRELKLTGSATYGNIDERIMYYFMYTEMVTTRLNRSDMLENHFSESEQGIVGSYQCFMID